MRLKNPLSAELDVLRPTMLFGMLCGGLPQPGPATPRPAVVRAGRVYG